MRLGRLSFVLAFVLLLAAFRAVIAVSELALPTLADVLAPRGINAAFALNGIWLATGCVFAAAMMWVIAARLGDGGRPRWWAGIAVLPLGAMALLNDAIFLVSRSFVLPLLVNRALIATAVLLAAWVVAECLLRPSRAGD